MQSAIKNSLANFPVVLCFLFTLVSCTTAPGTSPKQSVTQQKQTYTVLKADNLLHQRLQDVFNADNAFAQLATRAVPTQTLDSQNEAITQAEIALQQSIDSLQQSAVNDSIAGQMQQTIGYFKTILQSRAGMADLRMVLSANSDDSTAMQQSLAQLRTELERKNSKIISLERTRNTLPDATAGSNPVTDTEPKAYAPAKGESLADLKQRNRNLSLAYSSLQNKYFIVGRNYLLLKQEHDRALTELAALRKNNQR